MKKRILVVDDSATQREILKEQLEDWGYDVVEAEDGIEALDIVTEDNPPDAVLCDVEMPRMDGEELRRHMLDDDRLKLIPFAFVTGQANKDRVKILQFLADEVLEKPYSEKEALAMLNKILGNVSRNGKPTTC